MKPLLDRFLPSSAVFRPKSTTDFFALRLAHKLDDAAAANHYARLTQDHSESQLLAAYRRVVDWRSDGHLGRRFHVELDRVQGNGGNGKNANVIAVRVHRRAVAAVIFLGDHIEYTQVRQLASARDKALSSTVGFMNWITEQFRLDSAALEIIPSAEDVQRQILNRAVIQVLRDHLLPIWEVTKRDLISSYANPPPRFRKEIREVVADIWPVLAGSNGKSLIQDAAALGLYVQTERMFLH